MRPFVIIHGEKLPIGMMIWDRSGKVTKFTTRPKVPFGEFWDIEGDDLHKVTIIWEEEEELEPCERDARLFEATDVATQMPYFTLERPKRIPVLIMTRFDGVWTEQHVNDFFEREKTS